jgi:hypothetical protein
MGFNRQMKDKLLTLMEDRGIELNSTERRIYDRLDGASEPMSNSELSDSIGMSDQFVRKSTGRMLDLGLLDRTGEAREGYRYEISEGARYKTAEVFGVVGTEVFVPVVEWSEANDNERAFLAWERAESGFEKWHPEGYTAGDDEEPHYLPGATGGE